MRRRRSRRRGERAIDVMMRSFEEGRDPADDERFRNLEPPVFPPVALPKCHCHCCCHAHEQKQA
jgi:hypothetical protein